MNIFDIAKQNQEKAWQVIKNTNIIQIWEDAGAKINLVGSLRTGYNPQIEMFARFKMKSSFHKTKRII